MCDHLQMKPLLERLPEIKEIYLPFLEKLGKIYDSMDKAYQDAAESYDFHCTGCEDNCCMTRFHHHTFLEYLYLYEGFMSLDQNARDFVNSSTKKVMQKTKEAGSSGTQLRVMCPLNFQDRCRLYDRRPMICRLHGIPHELQKPGHNPVPGPGCDVFVVKCKEKTYFKFDRTPFYIEMAKLENELKQALEILERPKMTIAQMVDSWMEGSRR